MDYKRQTSNVYFPEVGPYRCEICFSILQTNRLFFDHIIGKHRADADETAIDKMKQHLNGAHRQHQNECFSTTMLKFWIALASIYFFKNKKNSIKYMGNPRLMSS